MKQILAIFSVLFTLTASAQNEGINISFDGSRQKYFGGFILDMGTMLNAETLTLPLAMPSLSVLAPWEEKEAGLKISPNALKFNSNIIYSSVTSTNLSNNFGSIFNSSFGNAPIQLQGASYRLSNGICINTYGEYDANGYKRHNPSAFPWQRNNFNAAFEMKSSNGNFGIKLEVTGGRGY